MILRGARMSLVVQILNSALPPQRPSPDTRLEHQDPISHVAQKKKEKKRKKNIIINLKNKIIKIKKLKSNNNFKKEESNQTNKQNHQ